jgi:hypothetical protein
VAGDRGPPPRFGGVGYVPSFRIERWVVHG